MGGFGSAILEFMSEHNYTAELKRLGMPDSYVEHGEQSELYAECGFDAKSISKEVKVMLKAKVLA
jgi:1-deoxy-D-xylulose-5-phosphate synthase